MSFASGSIESVSSQWYSEYQVPFCEPFICYVATSEEEEGDYHRNPTLWRCLPPACKTYLTALVAVIIMLAVITIAFNCLILSVNLASKTRRMRRRNPTMNNYSTYVVSLAIADLLVGVIVLPLCIANYYMEFMSNEVRILTRARWDSNITETIITTPGFANVVQPRLLEVADDNVIATSHWPATEGSIVREINLSYPTTTSAVIRDLLGLFTHLTLFVSVYTLITASADRLYAATHATCMKSSGSSKSTPAKSEGMFCRKISSFKRSSFAVCVVWLLGIGFAFMPLAMQPTFHFRQIGHIFVGMSSEESYSTGVLWYLWTLVVPLIVMWIFNMLICFTLWKRKTQLGLRRKRSLHRNHTTSTSKPQKHMSSRNTSASDDVFESEGKKTTGSLTECEARSKLSSVRTSTNHSSGHRLLRGTGSYSSAFQSSFTSLREASNSGAGGNKGIRRTKSSFRKARELLSNQSYEANITKTLCIVVAAFTVAVLPLIIVLSTLSREEDVPIGKLNKEVTALTCSLLIFFFNSFSNCVIYGARMRDFRSEVTHIFQSYIRGIKNKNCHCHFANDQNNFIVEASSNTFQFLKPGKSPNPGRNNPERKVRGRKGMTDEYGTDSLREVINIKTTTRTKHGMRLLETASRGTTEKCLSQLSPTSRRERVALTSEGFLSPRDWFSDEIDSSTHMSQEQRASLQVVTGKRPNAIYTRRHQQMEQDSSCSSRQTSWRNSSEPFQESGSSSWNVENENTLIGTNKNRNETTEAAIKNSPVPNSSETFRSDDTSKSLLQVRDYPTLTHETLNEMSKKVPTFDLDMTSADFKSSKYFDAACDYVNGNDGSSFNIESLGVELAEL